MSIVNYPLSIAVRRAFTLIELLIVIGIILILIGIVVVGLRHVNNTAARSETIAEMRICTDALREYQNINGLKNIESDTATVSSIQLPAPWAVAPFSGKFTLPIFLDLTNQATPEILNVQPASALATTDTTVGGTFGDLGDKTGALNPRWGANAVHLTQAVMFILLKDPKNRAIVSALPSKRLLETPPPINPGDPPPTPFTIDAAVPLDGWGNPIIFVPRGGIHVLMNPSNAAAPVEYIIRSSGIYVAASVPPVGPNDRPFFASAGQDGFFTDPANTSDYAIDNLYSFQDQ